MVIQNGNEMKDEEKYCGNCCWNLYEDIDGWGTCIHEYPDRTTKCDDLCYNGKFVSNETKRHHMAVLLQYNRWRRSDSFPPIYRCPMPSEIGRAIDFACEFIKQFEKI